jgi:hypothetical protein
VATITAVMSPDLLLLSGGICASILPTAPRVIHTKPCFSLFFLFNFSLCISTCYRFFAGNLRLKFEAKYLVNFCSACVYFVDNLWAWRGYFSAGENSP